MKNLTKSFLNNLVDKLNSYETGENKTDKTLSDLYTDISELKKELCKYEKAIKEELLNMVDTVYLTEKELKVFSDYGNRKTEYDMRQIIDICISENLLNDLSEISTIVKSKIADNHNVIKGIVAENSTMIDGNLTVKISKMNKQEISDN